MPELGNCQALRAEYVLVPKTDTSCPQVIESHHEAGIPVKGLDDFFHLLLRTNCEKGHINLILWMG